MSNNASYLSSLFALKQRVNLLTIKTHLYPNDFGFKKAHEKQFAKLSLFYKQRGKCCFCQVKMYADESVCANKDDMATIEHVIPKTNGGRNHISNYKISCNACNNDRGITNFDKYAKKVKSSGRATRKHLQNRKERFREKKAKTQEEHIKRFNNDLEYRKRVIDKLKMLDDKTRQKIMYHYKITNLNSILHSG
jgi:5-methylcytosine-specific restriction endonuclease McrA